MKKKKHVAVSPVKQFWFVVWLIFIETQVFPTQLVMVLYFPATTVKKTISISF